VFRSEDQLKSSKSALKALSIANPEVVVGKIVDPIKPPLLDLLVTSSRPLVVLTESSKLSTPGVVAIRENVWVDDRFVGRA